MSLDSMSFSVSSLIAGFIFGVIGIYVMKEARKNGDFVCFFIGIALMVYSIFFENPFAVWGLGVVLTGVTYKLSR